MKNQILLSGIKATGDMHVGNYFGAVKQWVKMQYDYKQVFIFIPDYHSIISVQQKEQLEQLIFDTAVNLMALGIDHRKVVFFKQSDVPAHTELTWIFNCITTMPQLMRSHAFKDSEAKNKEVSVGLFDYPVLQAADILLYDATVIPVGEDQQQHIEMAREISRKFNNIYGETFVEPQAFIQKGVGVVLGSDGRKMSKSYGNQLALFATEEETKKYIKSIAMDSKSIEEKKNPDNYVLYNFAKLFVSDFQDEKLRFMFTDGGVGYGEIKEYVTTIVNDYLRPMREKRQTLLKNPKRIKRRIKYGGRQARKIANKKMHEVRKKVGLEM